MKNHKIDVGQHKKLKSKLYRMKIQTPKSYDSFWVVHGRSYDFNTKTAYARRGTFVYSGVLIFLPDFFFDKSDTEK